MKTVRFYQFMILLLVVINLGTLAFFWIQRPDRHKPERIPKPREFLFRELQLTEGQQKIFQQLREEHREGMRRLSDIDKSLHERFFHSIFSEKVDSAVTKRFADSIAGIRTQMEILTFNHFLGIKQMLNPEQQKKFAMIFREMLHTILPPQQQRPDGPQMPPPPFPRER